MENEIKFPVINLMIKELLSQFSGAIVEKLVKIDLCEKDKATEIVKSVSESFGADVTLIKKKIKQKCSECKEANVSNRSKSKQYCFKCAKDKDDVAEEGTCIAIPKNGGVCGKKTYGSEFCATHRKRGEAIKKGKICTYKMTKGIREGEDCGTIIADDSKEQYCETLPEKMSGIKWKR